MRIISLCGSNPTHSLARSWSITAFETMCDLAGTAWRCHPMHGPSPDLLKTTSTGFFSSTLQCTFRTRQEAGYTVVCWELFVFSRHAIWLFPGKGERKSSREGSGRHRQGVWETREDPVEVETLDSDFCLPRAGKKRVNGDHTGYGTS